MRRAGLEPAFNPSRFGRMFVLTSLSPALSRMGPSLAASTCVRGISRGLFPLDALGVSRVGSECNSMFYLGSAAFHHAVRHQATFSCGVR